MDNIAILVKSFIGDFEYTKRLIESYKKYNVDKIPLYLVVPESDMSTFEHFNEKHIKVLSDESVCNKLVKDRRIRGIRPGYINQEIIKLAFWEKKLTLNYFCMDSDAVFIRNFYKSDFMYNRTTPYTILQEDNELKVDPEYYKTHWNRREKLILRIQKEVGLSDKRILTSHGFSILSSKVLASFYTKFMQPRKLNYSDLLEISPYEFSWYNMWLQKDKTIEIEIKEPLIKFFHQKSHHLDYLYNGVTLRDMARGYIGYNVNSNYSRGLGVVGYNESYKYLPDFDRIIFELRIFWSSVFNMVVEKFKKYV